MRISAITLAAFSLLAGSVYAGSVEDFFTERHQKDKEQCFNSGEEIACKNLLNSQVYQLNRAIGAPDIRYYHRKQMDAGNCIDTYSIGDDVAVSFNCNDPQDIRSIKAPVSLSRSLVSAAEGTGIRIVMDLDYPAFVWMGRSYHFNDPPDQLPGRIIFILEVLRQGLRESKFEQVELILESYLKVIQFHRKEVKKTQ